MTYYRVKHKNDEYVVQHKSIWTLFMWRSDSLGLLTFQTYEHADNYINHIMEDDEPCHQCECRK